MSSQQQQQQPSATQRLQPKKQTMEDAYSPPANFLEIDVCNPETHGISKERYTDYEIRLRTNLPVFKLKESSVRRRYSDFEWLRGELERDSKIVVPKLPGKALKLQLPFRGGDGRFDEEFIEERRKGLEEFINKVAGHPLAQNEKCLHMFLQEQAIDRGYVPGKQRQNHKGGPPGPYQHQHQQQHQQHQHQHQQQPSAATAAGIGLGQAAYLAGTATLVQDVDKLVLVVLRDSRVLIGWLRSLDQFANLMLHRTVERIYVRGPDSRVCFGDIERGLYLVRGENVLLMGEFEPGRDAQFSQVSPEEILHLQRQEREEQKKREERRKRAMMELGLTPTVPDAYEEFGI